MKNLPTPARLRARRLALAGPPAGAALALAFGLASPSHAQAPGDVKLYGRVVQGVNYQSGQYLGWDERSQSAITGSRWGIDGNVWGTSMVGFKGREDLGGGLQAQFILESGFEASIGSVGGNGSGLWTRRALVGLSGRWGSLKLGRDMSLPSDVLWALDPGGQQAIGTATLVKGRNWPTYSNQIDYTSPSVGGLTLQAVHGMGEAAGSTRKGSTGGVALAYVRPGHEVRAMYDSARDTEGRYSSLFQHSKEVTLGGTVTRDALKLFAGYQRLSAPAVAAGPTRARHLWLGATYQAVPALTLIGGAYQVRLNQGGGTARLILLGANYHLSSRTLLYASTGRVRNGPQTSFAVETGDSLAGQDQSAFYSGISHSF